jgi:purine-binding chemotaxis protein CheW
MKAQASETHQATPTKVAGEGKYLTFSLAGEEYGIVILKIKEIIGMMKITPIPQTPEYVKGVINLRGKVIPIIDLRTRFAMETSEYDERTCIIVVETNSGSRALHTGIVVDSVSEVINLKGSDIEEPPAFSHGLNTDTIQGMARAGGRVKILLDIDRVLAGDLLPNLDKAA